MQNIFGDGGLLSTKIKDYSPRQQQLEMALSIEQSLTTSTTLIAEAGTGTGKTYAYLAPAIMSGQKVFISTGTKNLQDQLFNEDIPTLKKALAVPFQTALLKGRSNYLCYYRLAMAQMDPQQKHQHKLLYKLSEWATITNSGDLTESGILLDDSPLWGNVTSTIDNCLGQECPDYDRCFVIEARKKAQEADIVVINHHLLMSDLALKLSGQGEVLPSAEAYIIDEAHQLPDVASQFLGKRVSSHQLQELCRDSIREMERDAEDMTEIGDHADKIIASIHALKITMGGIEQRSAWLEIVKKSLPIKTKLTDLMDVLAGLSQQLELAAERGKGLQQCYIRCQQLIAILEIFAQPQADNAMILWLDVRASGFVLHATPREVSQYFHQWMEEKPATWIFTSATLTVAGSFNNFSQQLAINNAETKTWLSPFNFEQQSLLYLPQIPVEPNHGGYNDYIIELAKQIIDYSQGRTFLLFTSYRAMHKVAEALVDIEYPLMVQGSDAKAKLLNDFRQHGNAVLLGTNSFWEGVDVRGHALACVIIDKIPFASPGDPILQARIDGLREQGEDPFVTIQIPAAVIQLKQGIGRLIRDPKDYGVLVLCDPRLLTKGYGKLFLRSLPAMPITQKIEDIKRFFKERSLA